MIAYLVFCSLLIPANLWAAITPHLHSDLSMRVLHGVSTLALLPLLWSLWQGRQWQNPLVSLVLGVFGVMLAVAYGSVLAFFLLKPEAAEQES